MRVRRAVAAVSAAFSLTVVGLATPAPAMAAPPASCADTHGCHKIKKPVHATNKPHSAKNPHNPPHAVPGKTGSQAVPPGAAKQVVRPIKPPANHSRALPKTLASARTPDSRNPVGADRAHTPRPPVEQQGPTQVIQQVAGAVEAAFNFLGWNLLALLPMAAIAITLSRRIRSPRRSAWL